MNNRYLPSITLASVILDEIITATELEVLELEKQLKKYDRKGNKEAAKVTVEVLCFSYRKLSSYKDMRKNLPKRSRQGAIHQFEVMGRESVI